MKTTRNGKSVKFARRLLVFLFLLILLTLISCSRSETTEESWKTSKITKGDLIVSVTATGTLQPEEVVDVGAQVAGLIKSFGTDTAGKEVNYGSQIAEGEVLARIDESLFQAEVTQAEAQLERAKADMEQSEAKLKLAQRDWNRAQKMGANVALSQSQYDSFLSNYEVAQAAVLVSKASIKQAQANLDRAKRNFDFTIIRAPVSGVVIDRKVNIGQTVVSSFNAPSLFLIAKDLKKMTIWVSVNEADIGQVFPGQKVDFAVDAFPGEKFEGEVTKIRLNASMTQNIVTYIVEVKTENASGRLLPYLTANVKFKVLEKKAVLLVPNSALRFTPPSILKAETTRKPSKDPQSPDNKGSSDSLLWIVKDGEPEAIKIKIQGTNGEDSEITGDEIKEGLEVITGLATKEKDEDLKNPFTVQMFKGKR